MIRGNTKFLSTKLIDVNHFVGFLKFTKNKNIGTQSTSSRLLWGVTVAIRSILFAHFSSSLFVSVCFLHRVWRWGLKFKIWNHQKFHLWKGGFLDDFPLPTHHNPKPGNWHCHPFAVSEAWSQLRLLTVDYLYLFWVLEFFSAGFGTRLETARSSRTFNLERFCVTFCVSTRWGSFAICLARSHRSMSPSCFQSPFSSDQSVARWLQEVEPVRSRTPTRRVFAPAPNSI